MKSFASSKTYRSFVNDRDSVLEALLNKSRLRLSDICRKYFNQILTAVSVNFDKIKNIPGMEKQFDHVLDVIFHHFASDIIHEYKDLRKKSYLFTAISDTEAMSRALDKPLHFNINKHKLDELVNGDAASGGDLSRRVNHGLMKLKHRISQSISLGILNDEESKDLIQRVYNTFPRLRSIPKKKPLKPIKPREADQRKISQRLTVGFLDDDEWKKIVDDYKSDFVPQWRGPETSFDVEPGYPVWEHVDGTEAIYAWEVERDMTHDFVQAVRSGMVDSAKQQGVKDFMVISIVDDKICENCCGDFGCIDFDGKTTKEIEEMTKGAQSIPPFHFNCRCTLAPVTEDLPDYKIEKLGDFDSWMNQ